MRRLIPNNVVENNERLTAMFMEMTVGGMGFDIVNDTQLHVRNYYKIIPLTTTATVSAATFYPGYSASSLAGVAIPQGLHFYGDFTSLQLSAGTIVGYYLTNDVV